MVFLVGQVYLDHQVQLENLARMEPKVFQAYLEKRDSRVEKAL